MATEMAQYPLTYVEMAVPGQEGDTMLGQHREAQPATVFAGPGPWICS